MDKLIAIAKECGAEEYSNPDIYDNLKRVVIDENQLRATVEQVCKQLLFVVDQYYRLHGVVIAQEALAAYTEIMGDKK